MSNTVLALIFTGLFSSSLMATSFEGTNQFEAVRLTGDLHVTCVDRGQRDTAIHYCDRTMLEPAEYAYFLGALGDMNQVELRSVWPNGNVVEKKMPYLGDEGQTHRRVNLWIRTLFQEPLLTFGENQILVRYKNNRRVVQSEEFTVNVVEGETRSCGRKRVYSYNMNDCRHSFGVCDDFFRQNNYCY